MTVRRLSAALLHELAGEASRSPRLRQHGNLHSSFQDPCQRVVNAIQMGSYIRPHRHLLDPKVECLVAIRGLFALFIFNDAGQMESIIRFGTEKFGGGESIDVGVELSPGTWHTVLGLVPESILLEVKAGPFDPAAAKEPASWAPEEGSAEAAEFLVNLRALAGP